MLSVNSRSTLTALQKHAKRSAVIWNFLSILKLTFCLNTFALLVHCAVVKIFKSILERVHAIAPLSAAAAD